MIREGLKVVGEGLFDRRKVDTSTIGYLQAREHQE